MKIVIIEDEELLAKALESVLQDYSDSIEILKILGSVEESLDYFENGPLPDLIFSDIQLGDGLSFEIFKKLQLSVPVIFCTAFDEYALEAFKVNGIDYVLKPFEPKKIKESLDRFKTLIGKSREVIDYGKLHNVIKEELNTTRGSLLVSKGDSILPISISDIRLVFIESSISYIICSDSSKYPVDETLDTMQQMLGPNYFRLNRQFIIHRKNIAKVSRYFGRKLLVHPKLSHDEQLLVSKENSTSFLRWLEQA